MSIIIMHVRIFLLRVRYYGAFFIVCIGALLVIPGEVLIKLGQWIGSRSK